MATVAVPYQVPATVLLYLDFGHTCFQRIATFYYPDGQPSNLDHGCITSVIRGELIKPCHFPHEARSNNLTEKCPLIKYETYNTVETH